MKTSSVFLVSCIITAWISSPSTSAEMALERGSVSLGGNVSYQSTELIGADNNLSTLIFKPTAMVYLFEGFAIGAELSFMSVSAGDPPTDVIHRYLGKAQYAIPIESRIIPFFHGGLGFIRESRSLDDSFWGTQHESEDGWTWELGFGLYAFLNDHFALKARADFFRDSLKDSDGVTQTTSNYLISIGFEGFIF